MEEFEDPAQGQNRASMPDLAAAIAAVALPVVPAPDPGFLVGVSDRGHPGGLSLAAARAWQDAAEDRYTAPWPRSPNSPGWKRGPRP